jgi:hypothetical protein
MSDYDDGWNEGYAFAKKRYDKSDEVTKLQAESECGAFDHCGCKDKVAQLKAVVAAAKAVGEERGIHRYYKPMDVAIDAMLDAIKEVESDA